VWTDVWRDVEEENRIWAGNRPEVDRQDAPIDDQETTVPGELSCEQLQFKKRRQAARDEVLGNDSAVVDETYGDEARMEGWDMPSFITQAENGDMGCESRDATVTHRSLSKLAHARVEHAFVTSVHNELSTVLQPADENQLNNIRIAEPL
jgi:hypothetical protein